MVASITLFKFGWYSGKFSSIMNSDIFIYYNYSQRYILRVF